MKLIIIGSVALDTVQTPYGKVEKVMGGSAAYASLSASKFVTPEMIGVVGEDYPKEYIELLRKNNVVVDKLEIKKGKTFHWEGIYSDLNQANTLETELNLLASFSPDLSSVNQDTKIAFLANMDSDLQLDIIKKLPNDVFIAADTMNYWIKNKNDSLRSVIKQVDLLFANESEVKMLSGKINIFKAARAVLDIGVKFLIVKRGEYGSFLISKEEIFFLSVYPVENVIDPTGAGDSFAGGLLGHLAQRDIFSFPELKKAMLSGTILASYCIQSFSTDSLINIDKNDIEKRREYLIRNCKIESE